MKIIEGTWNLYGVLTLNVLNTDKKKANACERHPFVEKNAKLNQYTFVYIGDKKL